MCFCPIYLLRSTAPKNKFQDAEAFEHLPKRWSASDEEREEWRRELLGRGLEDIRRF